MSCRGSMLRPVAGPVMGKVGDGTKVFMGRNGAVRVRLIGRLELWFALPIFLLGGMVL
jgi:hypothetical protein